MAPKHRVFDTISAQLDACGLKVYLRFCSACNIAAYRERTPNHGLISRLNWYLATKPIAQRRPGPRHLLRNEFADLS